MFKYRQYIAMITLVVMFAAVLAPAAPAQAFSLSDLTGQTTGSDKSSGNGIFNILLGLLLGNLFNNMFGSGQSTGDKPGLPGTLTGGKEMMGFYAEWWPTDTSSYTSLAKNIDKIRTIIPYWGTIEENGALTDRGGKDHASVVKYAHANNTKVLLLVNNAKQTGATVPVHTVLASPALRKTAINNLEAYIKKFNLDGVNIDFEMVPAGDRDNLTAFMKELYGRLKPQGYIVSIDVFPKTDENNDVSAAYDYGQLALYADRIAVMTYDNHGVWSGPGPIADINWVENSLKYALRFIPKHKLYLGVAGYGYDWSSKGVESREYAPIMDLADKHGAAVKWDEASKSPFFNYTDSDGVSHTVWFENARSAAYKLDLVKKYDIAGAALWKLGEEDPALWRTVKEKFGP
ncbi:glycosyl hydrolase family 18 protein [Anaeroselena agilis]|uniref:Glycosyl hydrolase family 18 protein n=1 Tax=Anaeroselena agilis TaxID=3063788 RepID=A0ABU3NX03_9FIRM|nr:glycosyl hydrolase family 18 protein [Selenomonadales bacterium 4137-cl]